MPHHPLSNIFPYDRAKIFLNTLTKVFSNMHFQQMSKCQSRNSGLVPTRALLREKQIPSISINLHCMKYSN